MNRFIVASYINKKNIKLECWVLKVLYFIGAKTILPQIVKKFIASCTYYYLQMNWKSYF